MASDEDRTNNPNRDFLLAEQTRLLYMQAPISNATVFAVSALYYFVLLDHVPGAALGYWVLALDISASLRMILWLQRRRSPAGHSPRSWLRRYTIGSVLVGTSWSLIVPQIYLSNDLTVAIALCMLVFGVISSAVVVLSIHFPTFVAYAYPQLLAFSLTLLQYGDGTHMLLSVAVTVYLLMTTLFTRNLARNHERSILLQARNQELIEDLGHEIDQRENLVNTRTQELRNKNQALTQEAARREKAQRELLQSEQRLKAFFGTSPAGLGLLDKDLRFRLVNETLAGMHGLSVEQNKGKTVAEVLGGNAPANERIFRKIFATGEPVSNMELSGEVPSRPGEISHFTVSYFPIPGVQGETAAIGVMVIDISDRKRMEEALRASEERFELAMRGTNDGVYDWNLKENSIYFSPRWKSMLGYSDDELSNDFSVWEDLVDPLDREASWDMLTDYINGRRDNFNLEFRMRHKDGHWVDILSRAFLVRDEAGSPLRMVGTHVDISDKKRHEKDIWHQAHYDELTKLPNRFLAMDRLMQLLKESARSGDKTALLFLDLDGFKRVNDSLGHATGDRLLVQAAGRLQATVREGDSVCRLGGDEFIVLLRGIKAIDDVRAVATNLVAQFREPFVLDGRQLVVTSSMGISLYPDDGKTPEDLLRNADTAMYHSKEQGRNEFNFYTPAMNRDVSRRLNVEEQLHGALARDEISILFQPIIDLADARIVGAEVVARWHNPTLGDVPPAEFIPVAEQTGFILEIGQYVLDQALRHAAQWISRSGTGLKIAVNLSPRQFRDPGLVGTIQTTLQRYAVPAENLVMEITEGLLLGAQRHVDQTLTALSHIGVRLSMDDFGTGYSSLSYLRRYPFDTLKIDRSFVRDVNADSSNRELVNATILMAHALKLDVVAEGVETREQVTYLKSCGCESAQGFYFHAPLGSATLGELLAGQEKTRA